MAWIFQYPECRWQRNTRKNIFETLLSSRINLKPLRPNFTNRSGLLKIYILVLLRKQAIYGYCSWQTTLKCTVNEQCNNETQTNYTVVSGFSLKMAISCLLSNDGPLLCCCSMIVATIMSTHANAHQTILNALNVLQYC